MKHLRIILTLGVVVFVLATLSLLSNTWAVENVRMTRHNLSTNPNIMAQGTTEVCIFCHTPHGGDTAVAGPAAPIWNRNMAGMTPSANFIQYSSPNFDALGDTPGKPKGVSLACLSCHDGSLAFDALLNFGGSGSVDNITGFAPTSSTPKVDPATGRMINTGSQLYPMLGTDLSNDHPISMEIPCGTGKDPQFAEICNNLTAGPNASQASNQVKYLFRGAAATLPGDLRDRIRAYPSVGSQPYIECASCHNPHEASRPGEEGSTATDTNNSRFLRYPSFVGTSEEAVLTANPGDRNAGSLLCLSCHQK